MKKIALLLLVSLTAMACDDTEDLTCEVLAAENFCWKTAITEAYACTAEAAMEDCEMAADNLSCTYPTSGITADFQPALDPAQSVLDIENLDVTVNADGTQCARFIDADDSIQLTTASGTVLVTNGSTYKIECQDGTVYATSKPFDLLSCSEGLFDSPLPGSYKSGSGRYWTLGPSPSPEGSTGWLSMIFPE